MAGARSTGRWTTVRLGGLGLFAVLLVVLHVVQPGLDPARRFVSDYALGTAGWLFTTAMLAYAAGVAAAAADLARQPVVRRPLLVGGLVVVALGVLVAGVVATDPPGVDTASGGVHTAGAAAAFVGTAVLALASRLEPRSGSALERVLLGGLRLAPALGLVALVTVPDSVAGAVERLLVAAELAWVALAPSRVARADVEVTRGR